MAKQYKIITLHIALDGIEPPIWRRVAVDGDITLRALHHIIQTAFGWNSSHLHEFQIEDRIYSMLDVDAVLDSIADIGHDAFDDRKAKLQRLVYVGQVFSYQYDFGDDWLHTVKVEKIEERPEPMESATLLVGERACPPDDVGGPYGYENFLETITKHPHSEEGQHYLRWVGGDFDPDRFDRRMADVALLRMAWNGWGKK
jgi:hypothetical protein